MGRSQESFSKKEREKKKAKKKEEKAKKKVERHNEPNSLDDMIAYVDEFGNITDTPPDPLKRKKVKAEDIEISVPKAEDVEEESGLRKGVMSFFNESKGYGFIVDHESGERVFSHVSDHLEAIQEGDKVVFEINRGPKGLNAIQVKVATK